MKTIILTLICGLSIMTAKSQDTGLAGTWKLTEFTKVIDGEEHKSDEKQLKKDNSEWLLTFEDDGKVVQKSNMRNGSSESWEGTHSAKDDKLSLMLIVDGKEMPPIVYDYVIEGNKLLLKRSSPDGSVQIIVSFMKA